MGDDYNQGALPPDLDEPLFEGFSEVLRPGDRAVDGPLVDARTGEPTTLAALWAGDHLVVEFGSGTCPPSHAASPALDAIAADLAPRSVQVLLIYVREAHPGEHRPPHRTLQDKVRAARRTVDAWGIERPVYADALDGYLHRHYGLLPHMAWVIERGGRVAFKASWTDPRLLRTAAEQLLYEEALGDVRTRAYQVEWQPRLPVDDEATLRDLAASGPSAVRQYLEAVRTARGPAAARPRPGGRPTAAGEPSVTVAGQVGDARIAGSLAGVDERAVRSPRARNRGTPVAVAGHRVA